MTAGIPASIKAMAEMSPVEDLILAILRPRLIGVDIQSQIADDQTFPLVIIRRHPQLGAWRGDPRFVDSATLRVDTFAEGLDADEDAAILGEAVRVALYASLNEHEVIPGRGHLTKVKMSSAPRRAPDWVTATGPVQYADLPTGVMRYETIYNIAIRKPALQPYPLTP